MTRSYVRHKPLVRPERLLTLDEKRACARRHAYIFAIRFCSVVDAVKYASWIEQKIQQEPDPAKWPCHAEIFLPWADRAGVTLSVTTN